MNTNKVPFTNECDLDFIDFYEKLEKIRNEHKESFSKDKFSTEMLELIGEHKNEDQAQTACQKVRQIYDVFDNFIKKDAFEAFCKLRKNKALFFWENEHFKVNSKHIDDIEQYYSNIVLSDTTIADYDYVLEQHEKLLFAVNRLKTFDISPSAVKGLDNESIDVLKAYNKVITDFKNKAKNIEKCMMELVEAM